MNHKIISVLEQWSGGSSRIFSSDPKKYVNATFVVIRIIFKRQNIDNNKHNKNYL